MPDWSRTVHGLGDLHAGKIRRARVQRMLDDVNALGKPAFHLQSGDSTETGRPEQDVMARRWLGRLPAPFETILGNHDIWHNDRSVKAWARAWGRDSQNFTIDLPFVRIVAVGPDRDLPKLRAGVLSSRTLGFLEQQLAGGPEHCWVGCHWPLHKTVMGDTDRYYTSTMQAFYAKPNDEIRALLARHPNAKAWISGHTHSPMTAPGFVTRAKLDRQGKRKILAINCSALVGTGKQVQPRDPINSIFITQLQRKIEVRFRSHRRLAWAAIGGRTVLSVEV